MEILNKIIEVLKAITVFLDGNKTYILGAIIAVEGLIKSDMNTVLMGLAVITGRQAIGKLETNLGIKK